MRNAPSEADPSFGGMVTSAPLGGRGDPEVELWQAFPRGHVQTESPLEFRDRAEFVRHRLIMLHEAVEARPRQLATKTNDMGDMLSELRVTYSEFCSLRSAPHAWQSIEAGDAELLAKTAKTLTRNGR